MKRKVQLFVSITTFIIILGGFTILSLITRKIIFEEIKEQVEMDNKSIGEEILRFLETRYGDISDDHMRENLQNLCDEIMLPNSGFICATTNQGELIAAPGLKKGQEGNLDIINLTNQATHEYEPFTGFESDQVYQGIINFENGNRTNIIASIPMGMSGIRLNVHQDNEAIRARAKDAVKNLLFIGIIAAIILSIIGYITVNNIIRRYESTIEKQNRIITRKNKEMTDSLNYARFLQSSYLPSRQGFEIVADEFFILQKPKDIVSGDFFWVDKVQDEVFFAAIDCTGHGVPGSLLSMIAYGLLEQALRENNIMKPSAILDYICSKFADISSQHVGGTRLNDGMDLALCCYNKKKRILQYAGARNPLWLARENIITEYKASPRSIGGAQFDSSECFENHVINLSEEDNIYIFSDGYADQFGGPDNKKFMKGRFKDLLAANSHLTMSDQKEILEKTLADWMEETEQIDDILVIGVSVR